jgi:hypothetical protein
MGKAHMTISTDTVEITCSPGDGILTVSAETVAALDRVAATIPADAGDWALELRLPAATLTARPAHHRKATA